MLKSYRRSVFLCLLLLQHVVGASSKDLYRPATLAKAVDLFFIENETDAVLFYLSKTREANVDAQTLYLASIIEIAAICESGKYTQAREMLTQLEQPLEKDVQLLTIWRNCVEGLVLFRNNQYADAYRLLNSVAVDSNSVSDERLLGFCKRLLARISMRMSDYSTFLGWMEQSTAHYRNSNLMKSVYINEKFVGRYYMLVDKHHLAIEHFKNSLNGLKKFDDSWEVFFVYVNLTDFYLKTRDLDMASAFADSSMNLAGKYQHDNMYSQAYVNLGEIALEQRNYNKAIPLFLESYKYFNKTMDYRGMIVSCINLSSTFRQLNHPESALIYARRAIVLAEKSNGKELMRMANNNLAMQYYAANMADSAFLCAIKAMAYKDSIYNAEASVGTSYYEVKLGLEQKESQLHMMQIESHKQRQLVFGLTIFLLVVLIALGIIVWLMRSNEKMLKSLVLKNIDVTREREKYRMELMASQSPHSSGVVCPLLDGEKSTQLYNMAVSWIEQYRRYADKDLTLDLVARELGTNRDYLSRAINEKYGRFTDFLNSYRIHEAKIVLSNPEHPCFYHKMEYVADYVGFTSYSAFVDAFRKETQMTPSLFRKNLPVKVDLIC